MRYPVLWASSESSHRQGVYADGPSPLRTTRQFPRYDEIAKPAECCHAVMSLYAQGWSMRDDCSLSGGIATNGLRHSEEVGRGKGPGARLEKSHANTSKTGVDLPTREVRKRRIRYSGSGECSLPSSNEAFPLLHEPGSRIMAENRRLYGIKPKPQGSHQPKPHLFKATSRHERWCLYIRYTEKQRIPVHL
ncbi:MAG: hypothetical protein ACXVCM_14250 [Ktedonobacteraceae bacterium]